MIIKQSHAFSSNFGHNCTRSSKSYSASLCTILTTSTITVIPNWTRMRVITYTNKHQPEEKLCLNLNKRGLGN